MLGSQIVRSGNVVRSLSDIDEIVRVKFLSTAGDQERNLRFVKDSPADEFLAGTATLQATTSSLATIQPIAIPRVVFASPVDLLP